VDEAERLSLVAEVLADQPVMHPEAPNRKVWRTEKSCYEFLARHVSEGANTLETGAGISTVLFTAWGCNHLMIAPDPADAAAITTYCGQHQISTDSLQIDSRPSEEALPGLGHDVDFDLFFIDGAHSFPLPTIDWFYGASHVRQGGFVVFDDAPLPAVRMLLDWFIEPDARWQPVARTMKWRAYQRLSQGSLAELESYQPFFQGPRSVKDRIKVIVPPRARRAVRRVIPYREWENGLRVS